MNPQLPIAGSSLARAKAERPSHGTPSPVAVAEKGCRRANPPHKREKAPEGLFGGTGALGAAQRLGKDSLENGRGGGDFICVPKGSAD